MHANRDRAFAVKYNEKQLLPTKPRSPRGLHFSSIAMVLHQRLDPLQMAIGFNALWSGFAIQGTVASAKPADEVISIFLKALIDSADPRPRNARSSVADCPKFGDALALDARWIRRAAGVRGMPPEADTLECPCRPEPTRKTPSLS